MLQNILKLISSNQSINEVQNNDGDTLLHIAAREKNMEAIMMLLAYDADVTIKNKFDEKASDVSKSFAITNCLLKTEHSQKIQLIQQSA